MTLELEMMPVLVIALSGCDRGSGDGGVWPVAVWWELAVSHPTLPGRLLGREESRVAQGMGKDVGCGHQALLGWDRGPTDFWWETLHIKGSLQKKKPKIFWQMSKLLWPPPPPLILTKNHFHFNAWKTLFDKFQKYVILPPTPTHLTPLESCQKVSKIVTNVTGDMISGKYAQTYTPIPLKNKSL